MDHNTSVDDLLNPVEMLDELSDTDTVLNEFLFEANSQPSTPVKMSGYLNDTGPSINQTEPSSISLSKGSSGPNTSEKFDSLVNEPICTSIDMASDTNHQNRIPNDGPSNAYFNFKSQVQPSQIVSHECVIKDDVNTYNPIDGNGENLRNFKELQSSIDSNSGNILYKYSKQFENIL